MLLVDEVSLVIWFEKIGEIKFPKNAVLLNDIQKRW